MTAAQQEPRHGPRDTERAGATAAMQFFRPIIGSAQNVRKRDLVEADSAEPAFSA
jgi:hypothetical protein